MTLLSEKIPYYLISDNFLVLKDGTLAFGFEISGKDSETTTKETRLAIAQSFTNLLGSLPPGVVLQFLHVVDYAATSFDLESSAQGLSGFFAEKRAAHYSAPAIRLKNYLFVNYAPHKKKSGVSPFYLFARAPKDLQVALDDVKARANTMKQLVAAHYAKINVEATPLDTSRLARVVSFFLNLSSAPVPKQPVYYPDTLVAHDLRFTRNALFLGNQELRTFSMDLYPESTDPWCDYGGLLEPSISPLLKPFPMALQVVIETLDTGKEQERLERGTKVQSTIAQVSRAASLKTEEQTALLDEIAHHTTGLCRFGISALSWDDDHAALREKANAILMSFHDLQGAKGVEETLDAFPLYLSFLPGVGAANYRRALRKTQVACDFISPYSYYSPTTKDRKTTILVRNRMGTPTHFDWFDPKMESWNGLVVGPTGTGKSFATCFLLEQLVEQGVKIFILDVGGSYKKIVNLLNQSYYEINPDTPEVLPVFVKEPTPAHILAARAVIERMMLEKDETTLGKIALGAIEKTVKTLYQTKDLPTLDDFVAAFEQNKEAQEAGVDTRILSLKVRTYLDGTFSGFFKGDTSTFDMHKDITCFDLKGIDQYPELQAILAHLITAMIRQNLDEEPERKKLIVEDECWKLMGESGQMGEATVETFRTARKANAGILAVTQSLEDIAETEFARGIVQNALTQIILKHTRGLENLQETLAYTDEQIGVIKSLESKGEAFVNRGYYSTVLRIDPSPYDYWLFTTNSDENVRLNTLAKEKGLQQALIELAEK